MVPNVPAAGRPNALPDEPMGVALNHSSCVLGPFGSPIRSGRLDPVSRSLPAPA